MEKQTPWNLINDYKDRTNNGISMYDEIKRDFNKHINENNISPSNENVKHNLKTGDIILFKNGYDIEIISEILGFDNDGKAFMLWDCYWFTLNLNERLIKKIV